MFSFEWLKMRKRNRVPKGLSLRRCCQLGVSIVFTALLAVVICGVLVFEALPAVAQGSGNSLKVARHASFIQNLDTIVSALAPCVATIEKAAQHFCSACLLAGLTPDVADDHSIYVSVAYDPQPLGCIVTVTTEILPAFAGVGAASRPVLLRASANSISQFTPSELRRITGTLLAELDSSFHPVKLR